MAISRGRKSFGGNKRGIRHDSFDPVAIIGSFKIIDNTEKSFKFNFSPYKGHHWIPKSQVVDKRFGIGRTPPKHGDNLEVGSWFFMKELRKRLHKIS